MKSLVVCALVCALLVQSITATGKSVSVSEHVNKVIPDYPQPGISVTGKILSNLIVEKVVITAEIDHPTPGDLDIVLTSPAGTQSVLSAPHGGVPTVVVDSISYAVGSAQFGPVVDSNVITGVATPVEGACDAIARCLDLSGKIAFVSYSKACSQASKAHRVQECGAVAMVVIVPDGFMHIEEADKSVDIPTVYMDSSDVEAASPVGKSITIVRGKYNANRHPSAWAMTSTRNFGEPSLGDWTLTIKDGLAGDVGKVTEVTFDIYGAPDETEESHNLVARRAATTTTTTTTTTGKRTTTTTTTTTGTKTTTASTGSSSTSTTAGGAAPAVVNKPPFIKDPVFLSFLGVVGVVGIAIVVVGLVVGGR